MRRLLKRRGLLEDDPTNGSHDDASEDQPVLAELASASVEGRTTFGRRCGARLERQGHMRDGDEAPRLGECHARANGFDLHAGLRVPAGHRARLERVCRYALRPPVAQGRLHLTEDGQVQVRFRHPWQDGTTAMVFDPIEFLGRLAVLVPRPRINLVLYHGVLAPRAARRAEVVRRGDTSDDRVTDPASAAPADPAALARRQARGQCWAAMMARTFGCDVLACPRCGGRLRLIALIEEGSVIRRILTHLGKPTDVPVARPPRAPPVVSEHAESSEWVDTDSGPPEF